MQEMSQTQQEAEHCLQELKESLELQKSDINRWLCLLLYIGKTNLSSYWSQDKSSEEQRLPGQHL
jgi:hypothetical protein